MSTPIVFPHPREVYFQRMQNCQARARTLSAELTENPTPEKFLELQEERQREKHWMSIWSGSSNFEYVRGAARRASIARREAREPPSENLQTLMSVMQLPDAKARTANAGDGGLDYTLLKLLDGAAQSDTVHEHVSTPAGQGMDTNRTLGMYEASTGFGPLFGEHLRSLGPDETYLDVGAGQGRAADEAMNQSAAKVVAVDLMRDPNISSIEARQPERFRFIEGNAKNVELPKDVSVITDYFGGLSYEPDLSAVLQRYLDALKVGGRVYFKLYEGGNYAVGPGGKATPLADALAQIPGARLKRLGKDSFVLTKRAEETVVPKLVLGGMLTNPPPVRFYRSDTDVRE